MKRGYLAMRFPNCASFPAILQEGSAFADFTGWRFFFSVRTLKNV
jgi:hypothetical protein